MFTQLLTGPKTMTHLSIPTFDLFLLVILGALDEQMRLL